MTAKQVAPAGLGCAGKALWTKLTAKYELMPHELAVLELAAKQLDDVAMLEGALKRDGLVVPGYNRQPRLNGVVTELRQARLAVGKLLGAIALPDDDEDDEVVPLTATQRGAKKAADVRWSRERRRKEADRGAAS